MNETPTLTPVLKTHGQLAYEAYCETTGWKSLISGHPLPQWSNVQVEIKDAWENAGNAVVGEMHLRVESLTKANAIMSEALRAIAEMDAEYVNGLRARARKE